MHRAFIEKALEKAMKKNTTTNDDDPEIFNTNEERGANGLSRGCHYDGVDATRVLGHDDLCLGSGESLGFFSWSAAVAY